MTRFAAILLSLHLGNGAQSGIDLWMVHSLDGLVTQLQETRVIRSVQRNFCSGNLKGEFPPTPYLQALAGAL
jgi:hypothetical protein